MNSESIAAAPAQEHIDAVEVQERQSWPSAPAAAYCDTWLMVNAGALNFKASEEHQVAAMANIGYQLLQEIAAYRPAFQWTNSPAEIVGSLVEEAANKFHAPAQPATVPDGWKLLPIWPTPEMLSAIAGTDYLRLHASKQKAERNAYDKLISVAPTAPTAQGDAMELSNDEIVSALHSLGIDTYPSKYGFPETQVSATNIPGIRRVLAACAAIATSKAGAR